MNPPNGAAANTSDSVSAAWNTIHEMGETFLSMCPLLAAGAVVFALFWLAAAGIRRVVEKLANRKSDIPGAATAFGRLAYFALMLFGLLVALTVSFPSVTPAKLFSLLGLGGVAIGFAFKDIFQNLVSGILLLVRRPFRIGDEITSGSFTGTVEAIETRATYIRTYDGKRIIVPNSVIYTEPVTVITAYDLLRSEYDIGIGYGDDVSNARDIALDTIRTIEGVLEDPAPDVLLWELAGSTKNLRLRWWTRPKRANVVTLRH